MFARSLLRRVARWGPLGFSGLRSGDAGSGAKDPPPGGPAPSPVKPAAPAAGPAPVQPSIVLEAAAGQTALGMFLVENHLATPINGQIVVSAVSAPEAGAIELPFALDPPVAALNPLDRVLARLSLVMPEHLVPGVAYAGHVAVPDLSSASIPLVVRRLSAEDA